MVKVSSSNSFPMLAIPFTGCSAMIVPPNPNGTPNTVVSFDIFKSSARRKYDTGLEHSGRTTGTMHRQ